MTICRFYREGRCRYGERCWNEHIDPSPAPQRRDNYTWVSSSFSASRNYSQPQSPRGNFSSQQKEPAPRHNYGNDYNWNASTPRNQQSGRYGWNNIPSGYYDNRDSEYYERSKSPKQSTPFQAKPSNRFEVLSQQNDTRKSEKDSTLISTVKSDIAEWEESHIWPFSCHSHFKDFGVCLSGFVDLSPEELRYKAYEAENSGSFALYIGIVADAMNEVKKKWDVLKNPTPDVLQSIKGYQGTPDFCAENLKKLIGESATAGPFSEQINSGMFAPDNSATAFSGAFSFKQALSCSPQSLGSSTSAFKSVLPSANKIQSSFPTFGAAAPPPLPPPSSSGFGSASTSVFASSSSSSSSVSSGFGSSKERHDGNTKTAVPSDLKSCAYTPLENLTESERTQFSSQTFTLGKIPSRPPPMEFCF